MKRTFTIGRDPSCCDIVVYDVTDVVSRSHATLRVDGRRYFITDHSTNGTYRNGMRLTPYVEYRIKPGDDISFGNAAFLDWSNLPHSKLPDNAPLYFIIIFLLAVIVAGAVLFIVRDKKPEPLPQTEFMAVPKDTVIGMNHHKDTVTVNTPAKDKPQKAVGASDKTKAKARTKTNPKAGKDTTTTSAAVDTCAKVKAGPDAATRMVKPRRPKRFTTGSKASEEKAGNEDSTSSPDAL